MKKNYLLISIITLVGLSGELSGQCHIPHLQSTGYSTGDCGVYSFQSILGSVQQSYGDCGDLYFTPPLTDGDGTISNKDNPEPSIIQITPNPASDYLLIRGLNDFTKYTITIYFSTGQIVAVYNLTDKEEYINISALSRGLYFLIIYSRDIKAFTHKFIKI
jgi:hypothetical protein